MFEGQYKSLNDAVKVTGNRSYLEGNTYSIWYVKYFPGAGGDMISRDFMMGLNWLKEKCPLLVPDSVEKLKESHVCIGSISGEGVKNLDDIYYMMQGENWSPNGEARSLIHGIADHTSMSIGDVIQKGDELYIVNNFGFEKLN